MNALYFIAYNIASSPNIIWTPAFDTRFFGVIVHTILRLNL